MSELFKKKHWIGQFFIPDDFENRFLGEIDYSPEDGIQFSFKIAGIPAKKKTAILHGILDTGEACTLIGGFDFSLAGMNFNNGLVTSPGKSRPRFMLVGDLLAEGETIEKLDFSLTNMQEFFFPAGYKDLVKFSSAPLYSLKTSFGELDVGNNANFSALSANIEGQFYCRDDAALSDLVAAFDGVKGKHPNAIFMLKKDIAYRIFLKFSPGLVVEDAYKHVAELAELFALLIYNPVYPESINITKKSDDGGTRRISVYPSMRISPRTVERCISEHSYHFMPITKSNIPLDKVIENWLGGTKNYSIVVSGIQSETGFRSLHDVHGEIVLYSTLLESISYASGNKDKKYEYPIDRYACNKVHEKIKSYFSVTTIAEVGTSVGDLRNEIAHVGKPKKLLKTMTLPDLVRVSQCLQLTIVGYILEEIGVTEAVSKVYQERFVM